jgi:hypothetical protein
LDGVRASAFAGSALPSDVGDVGEVFQLLPPKENGPAAPSKAIDSTGGIALNGERMALANFAKTTMMVSWPR